MLQLVWYKRDLRVEDHAPLAKAAARGPVLPLYVIEPALWRQPDMAGRHWAFIAEALGDLDAALAARGQALVVRRGEMPAVLQALHDAHGTFALWSHEETGSDWTYRRDRRVADWCRAHGVPWTELPGNGVVRGLRQRTGWSRRWQARMAQPRVEVPTILPPVCAGNADALVELAAGIVPDDPVAQRQPGGRAAAEATLRGFLDERGHAYHRSMSSPLSAERSCSRLSPHLAWGTLSMREVVQTTERVRAAMDPDDPASCEPRRALHAFLGRLHWHCHFMQKLEAEPRLEFENLHSAYDGLREPEWSDARFAAWCAGRTGLPFVDACMRYLRATGWLNFRMRAMLVAVASYHLWLHWREPAQFLARQFTDYEPGIHFSQMQMQSGTTGINTPRIYNPVKQGLDHDPDGRFIRRWVPELAGVADADVHEPWKLPAATLRRDGADGYPAPVVDHLEAARAARRRIWAVRGGDGYRREADAIQERHGSRRSGMAQRGGRRPHRSARTDADTRQQSFDWGDGS